LKAQPLVPLPSRQWKAFPKERIAQEIRFPAQGRLARARSNPEAKQAREGAQPYRVGSGVDCAHVSCQRSNCP
jgi:hypothetical protein